MEDVCKWMIYCWGHQVIHYQAFFTIKLLSFADCGILNERVIELNDRSVGREPRRYFILPICTRGFTYEQNTINFFPPHRNATMNQPIFTNITTDPFPLQLQTLALLVTVAIMFPWREAEVKQLVLALLRRIRCVKEKINHILLVCSSSVRYPNNISPKYPLSRQP